jgi:type IV pilus assembly protein PilN
MAQINLLPWREELRQQRKKEFLTIVGGMAIVAAGLVLVAHVYIGLLIDAQEARNNILRNEIKLVENKIKEISELEKKKEQLIARMRVIEQLQSNRPEVVHLFDEIAKTVPEGLYLKSLTQKGRTVKIMGIAQSNARVSAFMRSLEASPWFGEPKLDVISASKNGKDAMESSREFTLEVSQAGGKAVAK